MATIFRLITFHCFVFPVFLTIVTSENRTPVLSTNSQSLFERMTHLEEAVNNLTKLVTEHFKASKNTECPQGFTTIRHLTACYKFVKSTSDWFEAGKLCAQEGASLLEIDSEQEDEYIRIYLASDKALRENSFYTACNDIGTEGVYMWFQSGKTVDSVKWAPGEPSRGKTENCVRLSYAGTFERYYWYDGGCDESFGRICKISM